MTSLNFIAPHNQIAFAAPEKNSTGVSSWKVSTKRGTQSGLGVSVSGAGAWAKLDGTMKFKIRSLDNSKTYDMMKKEYHIGGGVSAFWSWLGISANAETHKEEIHEVFKEVSNSQEVDGAANVSLYVSGQYPNVQVDASGYVLIMQIEDSSGNTYNMMSAGDPASDTGAQDQNGNALPSKDNNSTITL
ncbi:hypothetical protein [Shewanella sp. CG12_big_fil_rev_8_21_14_0_65_47_15]|uniref:hypothetical protein n=1 Tax=Shewanella sp. CG12_big_fil_rev_8_21_14_0_65_47_15 TaxID=1975537 RepID=UPI000CC609C7|nr:hypothetical protein [Shewanella sp. CG12_big_fil_rev_8_21_14_0_65_47_15]PIW61348.1 MAG: hypothetical protein COW15_08600 [Shewanella sp. CG12_big_fil_rev_8_21_14_0_65_47_15]